MGMELQGTEQSKTNNGRKYIRKRTFMSQLLMTDIGRLFSMKQRQRIFCK